MNHLGQMQKLLQLEIPALASRLVSLTHNNGLPLTARWITAQITGEEDE
jgi:hypothetical protein